MPSASAEYARWQEHCGKRFAEALKQSLLAHSAFEPHAESIRAARVEASPCPQPGYLREGAWKVHASLAIPILRFECICLYCEQGGVACIFMPGDVLVATPGTVDLETIRSLIDLSDANKALEYFLDFATLVEPPSTIVLSATDLNQSNVQWFSPLLDDEFDACHRLLREHPIAIAAKDEAEYEITACALAGGQLVRRTYSVFGADKYSLFSDQNAQRCDIVPRREHDTTLAVLHDNYLRAPGSALNWPKLEFLSADGAWIEASHAECELIKRDLDRCVHATYGWPDLPLWCRVPRVTMRKRYLSFYELQLLEIRADTPDDERSAFVLWRPGYAVMLDGTSAPIHRANEDIRWLRWKRGEPETVVRDADEALDYVRFFCCHVWGEDGPFTIVESRSAPTLQRCRLAAGKHHEQFATTDAVLDAIEPLSLTAEADAGSNEYRIAGWIAYGAGLFIAGFLLRRNGDIEMTDDSAIAELQLCEGQLPLDRGRTYSVRKTRPTALHLQNWTPCQASALPRARSADCAPQEQDVIENRVIFGTLQTRELGIRVFKNCRFRNRVDLSGLRTTDSLSFSGCIFEGGLSLTNAVIEGVLRLHSCVVLSDRPERSSSIDADHLRAEAIEMQDVYASHSIGMNHAVISQRVQLENLRTDRSTQASLYCYALQVGQGYFWLRTFILGGDLTLDLARIGTIAELSGDDDAHSVVAGDCSLNGLKAENSIRVIATDIGGSLGLRSIQTDFLSIRSLAASKSMRVGKDIDLRDCLTHRHALIANVAADVARHTVPSDTSASGAPSIRLSHARIGGDLCFFADAARATKFSIPLSDVSAHYRCDFPHGIDLSNATIEGDVDMAAVACGAGNIDLSDASIGCDLLIAREPEARLATARHLLMDGMQCEGHTDVSGIQVTGDIAARFGRFGTTLKVATSTDDAAEIAGRLDLTGATLNELAVSVKTFWLDRTPTAEDLDRHAILLKQAKIEKLTIYHDDQQYPRPIDLRYANVNWWEFRGRDGQSGSDAVEQYKYLLEGDPNPQLHTYRSIEQNLVNRGHEDAADEIYWEMRRWLFKDRLRKTWSRCVGTPNRASSDTRSLLLWPVSFVRSVLSLAWQLFIFVAWTLPTSYKRTPAHLLITMFAWFVVSTAIFSQPANIAPSEAGLTANRSLHPGAAPEDWRVADGAWLALRHHVPIAMFTAREEWEPTNDRPLSVPLVREPLSRLNAEDYANIVLTLHWLWWPIVLISSSRKYFRRSGQ